MRLRTLLALVFAACALIVTFAGTVLVSRFVAVRVQIRAEARMADLADHLRQIIDANIAERLGDMAVLSSVAQTTAATADARRAWVDAMRQSYPAYAWIGFTDRRGFVIASTGGLLEGESVTARPWFRAGLDHPVVVDVHEAALLAQKLPALPYGEPKRFVDVAAPMRDASGGTVGVVGGHLSVRWMREISRAAIASALARDPSVSAMILASDGTVVLRPGDQDGERLQADLPALAALAAGAERASARGPWPDGHEYFTGASRAQGTAEQPTLPWTIVVRQPVEIAQTISGPILNQLILGGAVFALLFALLGWWAAEHLAGPLRKLATAASGIGHAPDGVLDAYRHALAAGQRFHGYLTNYRADGTKYRAEVDCRPFYDAHGRIDCFVAFEREVVRRIGRPVSTGVAGRSEPASVSQDLLTDALRALGVFEAI